MKKRDVINIKIEKIKFPAKGMATVEGKPVTVKNALPGQTVEVRITKNRSDKAEGRVLEVIERAPYEVDSFCEHFGRCGGCARQTVPYEKQTELKAEMVKTLIDASGMTDYEFQKIIPSPQHLEYRNKMEFSFGDEMKDGPMTLGMHKKGRHHDVVTVEKCHIVDSDFTKILQASLDYFTTNEVPLYKKKEEKGFLRHLTIRKGIKTGEILVGLSATTQVDVDLKPYAELLNALDLKDNIVGVLYIKNDGLADMVAGDIEVIYGRDHYFEELFDLRFKVSFFSFFQTNTMGAEVLYDAAMNFTEGIDSKVVFDLFSGTGTIGQIMAKRAKQVVGIELVADAVDAANENSKLNGITNCEFIAGDVFVKLDEIKVKPDVIVVDPPRAGIMEKALHKILNYGVKDITYVSCNPVTLADNLVIMRKHGYRLEKAVCVDMFPQTPHVETVVKLVKDNTL